MRTTRSAVDAPPWAAEGVPVQRRNGARLWVVAAALGALTASWVHVPASAAPPTGGDGQCLLGRGPVRVGTPQGSPLNETFARYGNAAGEWVGGDSTWSVPLRGGRTAWIFSDTLYGQVDNGKLSRQDSLFLHNSVVEERGNRLIDTHTGSGPKGPESLVGSESGTWRWMGAAHARRKDELQISSLKFRKTGPKVFDFVWDRNEVVNVDTRSWQVTSILPAPSAGSVQWGSWIERVPDGRIVYGVEDLGGRKFLHVAKVHGDDLADLSAWRFWDGRNWVVQEKASARIMDGVANELSVTRYGDGWLMITQDTTVPMSPVVKAYTGCVPTGPFAHGAELYRMPETGPAGSYRNPNVYGYNAHEHPELRRRGRILLSYNVNSMESSDLYADVTIYRPRFVEIPLEPSP